MFEVGKSKRTSILASSEEKNAQSGLPLSTLGPKLTYKAEGLQLQPEAGYPSHQTLKPMSFSAASSAAISKNNATKAQLKQAINAVQRLQQRGLPESQEREASRSRSPPDRSR